MGLRADILKSSQGSCSNGGISSRASAVTIVNVDGSSEPGEDAPAVLLVENGCGMVKVVPAAPALLGDAIEHHGEWAPLLENGEKTIGPMMGGCYIAAAGSRLLGRGRAADASSVLRSDRAP